MELQEGAMETLGKVSGGDLRKAITTLQSAVRLKVSDLPIQPCIFQRCLACEAFPCS